MSDDKESIEQEKVNKKSWWKKVVGFKPNLRTDLYVNFKKIFLVILAIVISMNITYALSTDGKFEYLKNTYGAEAVPINENEIFLPCYAFGNSMHNPKIMPAQIYNIKEHKFKSLNVFMNNPRSLAFTVKLDNENILVFGGFTVHAKQDEYSTMIAEIYNLKTNTFREIGKTNFNHKSQVSSRFIRLKDGKLFIITGGRAEIFDPKTEKFYVAGEQTEYYEKSILDSEGKIKRIRTTQNVYSFTAPAIALLNDGRVLLVGANFDRKPGNAEIYDPKTNKFTKVSDQIYPRFFRAATTLKDGRVLITGGTGVYYGYSFNKKETTKPIVGNTEIFDPKTNTFTAISPLNIGRSQHRSILLSNGKVLIVNGNRGVDMHGVKGEELYNPETNKFELIKHTKLDRYAFHVENISDNTVFINSHNGWELYKY